jgi:hypothetical protein
VELAENLIAARFQRSDVYRRLRLTGYDFFAVQGMTLELFGRRILVVDDEFDFLTRRDLKDVV